MEDAYDRLLEAIRSLMEIVDNSTGVANFHRNGDVAEWDEFEDVGIARDLLAEIDAD